MNKVLQKVCATALAVACAVLPAFNVVNVMAAPEDIINTSQKASLTIHKYDMTAAVEDGVELAQFTANGEKDAAAEAALSRYEIEGVEFTYVKVGDINTETVAGKVQLLYDIPRELEDALGLTDTRGDHKHTSDELNNALSDLLVDNTAGKNVLENYVESAAGKVPMPLTNRDGVTTATNLDLGLYLLVETKVPASVNTTVDPFFVSLPMTDADGEQWFYDVNVYPKNQTDIYPTVDKLVRQNDDANLYDRAEYADIATASEGDRVDFIFVSRLPKITSEATYLAQYTFVDKMDKGLTYNRDAAIYFYDNVDDAKANNTDEALAVWEHGSAQFTETYEGSNSEYNQMTIAPTREGLRTIDPAKSEQYLVVSYSATVNSNATPVLGDSGNSNDVQLTWKRTSEDFVKTVEDRARVYTYGINLTKEFSDTSKGASATAVKFVLQNKTDGHYITATSDQAGVYYVTDASKGAAEDNGTIFSPASNGKMIINGLEADTYVLTEIETADGFSLLKEPITIDFTCTVDKFTPSQTTLYDEEDVANNPNRNVIEVAGERASATVDGNLTNMSVHSVNNGESTNARVDMTVVNTSTFTLPNTGGYGTIAFTLAGCAAALAGIIVLTKKSKKDVQ